MASFNLISHIVDNIDNPKQKFQLFETEIGFEKASVLIPFENSDKFEETILRSNPKSIASMRTLVSKFGGEVL